MKRTVAKWSRKSGDADPECGSKEVNQETRFIGANTRSQVELG